MRSRNTNLEVINYMAGAKGLMRQWIYFFSSFPFLRFFRRASGENRQIQAYAALPTGSQSFPPNSTQW